MGLLVICQSGVDHFLFKKSIFFIFIILKTPLFSLLLFMFNLSAQNSLLSCPESEVWTGLKRTQHVFLLIFILLPLVIYQSGVAHFHLSHSLFTINNTVAFWPQPWWWWSYWFIIQNFKLLNILNVILYLLIFCSHC